MSTMSVSEDECGEWDDGKEQGVRVKLEKVDNQWAPPLYAEEPTLLLDLENAVPIPRKRFEEVYGLCNRGPSLKRLKIGRDVTEAEVEKFFGPCNGKNSYRYNYHEDEQVIKEVERLWMICHQRTVVPYNRSINKAEARGFALWKRDPSVPVNWCVFAEWTVRDRIRRLQRVAAKRGEAPKSLGAGISEGGRGQHSSDTSGPCGSKEEGKNLNGGVLAEGIEMAPVFTDRATSNDMILEWTNLLEAVENELDASNVGMKSLSQKKERCGQEHLRCSAQLTDRKQLLEGASARVAEIEVELAVLRAEVVDTPDVSFETLPRVAPLLRSFNSYVDMVQTFTEMFQKGERDHASAANANETAETEWDAFARQNKVLDRQAVEFQSQLRLLKLGYDLPTLHPRPPPFSRSGSDDCNDCCVISHPCSYCLGPFAPTWNCSIASCRHGYHSWCAKSWFANNRNCCFPGCEEEMHPSWWALFGLPKPPSSKEETKGLGLEGIVDGRDPVTPSASVSIQRTLRWARSGTVSPSVGSRVLDLKITSLDPVNPTSPNKKRKEGGQVEGRSYHPDALLPLSEKKRKGAVKKFLSPTVEADLLELEKVSSKGSSDEDCSEDEPEQPSTDTKELGSGKRKSDGSEDEGEIERSAEKKKTRGTSRKDREAHGGPASSEPKRSTSNQRQKCSGAVAFDEGVDQASKNGKKGKTPISERVSMAKTTRRAATNSISERGSVGRTRGAATKSKNWQSCRNNVDIIVHWLLAIVVQVSTIRHGSMQGYRKAVIGEDLQDGIGLSETPVV